MKEEQPKYIDVSRIPLICEDIRGIHTYMGEVNKHIERVEPIILSYEADQATKKTLGIWSDRTIKLSQVIIALGVIVAAIIYFIK